MCINTLFKLLSFLKSLVETLRTKFIHFLCWKPNCSINHFVDNEEGEIITNFAYENYASV